MYKVQSAVSILDYKKNLQFQKIANMSKHSNKPLVAITGASMGIGASTARRFAKEGYRLALLARRLDKLAALQKELSQNAFTYPLDVCADDQVAVTFKLIEKEHGPIDVLVNNAGCAFGLEPAYEAKLQEWEKCVQTNINGLLYCTQAVLPSMVARNSGHIINLGSVAGTYPYPGGNVYGATKAFVRQFSLNLRADLLGKKVRVSCIEPGLVEGTEFSIVRFRGDKERAVKVYEKTKALNADDVAEAIYFCHCLPPHVNINTIEMMPVDQAFSPLSIYRT
jgi:3-hydroxy acid dehydrogenase/malonic semialdehyde reductase